MTDEELEKIKHDEDKAILTKMDDAKKQFDLICDEFEGINCHCCPLNIKKESNLGNFEFCLRWGLNESLINFSNYMIERYKTKI